MIENVVIIGAGNLATQLALALTGKGIQVKQVFSRTLEAACELAGKVNAQFTNNLSALMPGSDLYIVSVKDSAIQEVMMNLPADKNRLVVHTAGSIPMEALSRFTNNYGVFYPLQSFSKYRNVDFSGIPICIEAHHAATLLQLQQLAERLSSSVHLVNSQERKTLHLAAVFVNNFVNHFYTIGYEILQDKKLNFDLLKPLIQETADKIESMSPLNAQTGPARRNDLGVISDQLNMLQDHPEFQKIYSFVSQSIYHIHQKQNNDLL
ncbi:MAG TPA: DUF2520 domain-containing protein [Prolixibacteraceae bacterium]|jgi:predicted short-subunit dehydrogenase-like oxidoreductase (DUF2520 family)|nr:DUF2520 domain-containing protein [Prolixibacteraceae bacterium]